ncbi:MAG: hypothetical protein H5U18_10430 [Rhodobacteraceae bacterium]|jgi:hypothetical protein|nr:hypothetical protein [Paracoccaceae bacterium]
MQLSAWDVVWPWDELVDPPNFKLWACVEPERLWFLRVNTRPDRFGAVLLSRADHPFLDHDSWFGCGGDLIMIREAEFQSAVERQQRADRRGIIGRIAEGVRADALVGIQQSPRLAQARKTLIVRALGG